MLTRLLSLGVVALLGSACVASTEPEDLDLELEALAMEAASGEDGSAGSAPGSEGDDAVDGAPPSVGAPVVPMRLCEPAACAGQPVTQIACADGTTPRRACVSVAGTPCRLQMLGCEDPIPCGGVVGDICPVGEQCVTRDGERTGICIETPPLPAPRTSVPCGPFECDADAEVCEIRRRSTPGGALSVACVPRAPYTMGCELHGATVCGGRDGVALCRELNGGTYAVCRR